MGDKKITSNIFLELRFTNSPKSQENQYIISAHVSSHESCLKNFLTLHSMPNKKHIKERKMKNPNLQTETTTEY
jgi:hypothetical protein|uniref:Uncharacterized protein n=1 Tax=Populus trichocarpa TaxID=3694 RepID=A0A2K1Y4J8_POPTR